MKIVNIIDSVINQVYPSMITYGLCKLVRETDGALAPRPYSNASYVDVRHGQSACYHLMLDATLTTDEASGFGIFPYTTRVERYTTGVFFPSDNELFTDFERIFHIPNQFSAQIATMLNADYANLSLTRVNYAEQSAYGEDFGPITISPDFKFTKYYWLFTLKYKGQCLPTIECSPITLPTSC